MINRDEITPVGKFQKTHALKGELNMISDIDPQYYLEGNPLIIDEDGILVPFFVESVRPKGSTSYLIKISGVDNENEASDFVNKEIYMLSKDADEWLEEELEESYEFLGYKIEDAGNGGKLVGEITGIEDSTSNVLFIVENPSGEEFFIPSSEDFIESIDDNQKIIRMRIPEGLLDINSKD